MSLAAHLDAGRDPGLAPDGADDGDAGAVSATDATAAAIELLTGDLAALGPVVVAFSGGVDSGVVATLALRAVPPGSPEPGPLAVTAAAESLAGAELAQARRLAQEIGIRHEVVTTSELADPEYVRNPAHRCFVCQGLRMDALLAVAARRGYAAVCDGTNASDPGPDRPGLAAVRARGVRSPLLARGIDKATVRAIARRLGLSAWDRPANACLSSRIPHGQPVTLGKLRRIEAAEELLAAAGFRLVRVRHQEGRARVEVGADEVAALAACWDGLAPRLLAFGFSAVAFDPAGYRRGGADPPRLPAGSKAMADPAP